MKCDKCNKECIPTKISTGYAITQDNKKICFDCCAIIDREEMIKSGHSKNLPLYYNTESKTITNWPGTLKFKATYFKYGTHNWRIDREDVWFFGPNDYLWHGVIYGSNTQIIHCKRTKKTKEEALAFRKSYYG